MKKVSEIYDLIDSRLKRNKYELKKHAKKYGFKYYSEYVCESLKTKSAREVRKEIDGSGIIKPPAIATLWQVKYIVVRESTIEKIGKDDKPCYMCNGKRKVAAGSHALCSICNKLVKAKASGVSVGAHRANGYSFNY